MVLLLLLLPLLLGWGCKSRGNGREKGLRFEAWNGWAGCHPRRRLNTGDGLDWIWILGTFVWGLDRLLVWFLEYGRHALEFGWLVSFAGLF